jgi:hypothetical protein
MHIRWPVFALLLPLLAAGSEEPRNDPAKRPTSVKPVRHADAPVLRKSAKIAADARLEDGRFSTAKRKEMKTLIATLSDARVDMVRAMLALQEMPATSLRRWQQDAVLHEQLGERYHALRSVVEVLRASVVRASSVVENVNSRLRNYLFLRKEVGQGSLELLRFYLNHHRFLRSEHPERQGKSPAELLTGVEHGHWLEMLGYQLFRRAA